MIVYTSGLKVGTKLLAVINSKFAKVGEKIEVCLLDPYLDKVGVRASTGRLDIYPLKI